MPIADFIYPELKTTEKLKERKNYILWKLKLDFYLANYGVSYVLTDPIPSEEEADRRNQWLSDNRTCILILYLTADMDLVDYLEMKKDTAKAIMDSINSNCGSVLLSSCIWSHMDLFKKFTNQRLFEGNNVNRHIFRLRALARELQLGGVPVTEEIQKVVLLNSLPDSWADVVESLVLNDLDKEEKLSLDFVCRKLMIAGEVRRFRKGGDAGNYDPNKHMNKICYTCGEPGHFNSQCPNPGKFPTIGSINEDEDSNYAVALTRMNYPRIKTTFRLNHMGTSFDIWKNQITMILEANEVNYVLTEPKVNETWLNDDLTCRHIILGAMEDDLFLTFHNYPSAKALMEAIDYLFNTSSLGHKMNMFNRYLGHRISDDYDARKHIFELDSITKQMEKSGIAVPDEMQAVVLMESLPPHWVNDSPSFIMMGLNMLQEKRVSLNKVKDKIRDVGDIMKSRMSRVCNDRNQMRVLRGNCFSCGMPGHHQSYCPN